MGMDSRRPVFFSSGISFHSVKTADRVRKRLRISKEINVNINDFALTLTYPELLHNLNQFAINDGGIFKSAISSQIWTPEAQRGERISLKIATKDILRALYSERVSLEALHWRQLEEIVAELLIEQGLQVHVVDERPQGGRDIIARGEIVPGLGPLNMAIEVKHRKMVGSPLLHQALSQNRYYPFVMVATSGRFTAGVIREKSKPENHMRLILKDGVAINDMIAAYGMKKKWSDI